MDGVGAPPGVEIRSMRAEDVDMVVCIESDAFSTPWQADTFHGLLDRPGAELLVMVHPDEGVIGYAVLWCILDQGELANIAVVPHLRGQGLGAQLLTRIIDIARERGVEALYLEVRASNDRAVELYLGFGFTEVGLRKEYYTQPKEDARVLLLRLHG